MPVTVHKKWPSTSGRRPYPRMETGRLQHPSGGPGRTAGEDGRGGGLARRAGEEGGADLAPTACDDFHADTFDVCVHVC